VCSAPLVGMFKADCGEARSIPPCAECDCGGCCDYLAGSVAHWNCFAEFVFESLHSDVSIGNRIGDEGTKALGNALKENSTLTSLSLDLGGE
jgi:hypothetical protein